MTARPANGWWLLPGAFVLVAVAVLDLRGGRLSDAAVDVGTGAAWYTAGAVSYLARPANRAAWLLLAAATLLAVGKGVGAGLSLAAASDPGVAGSWMAVVLVNAAGWSVLSAGFAVFALFPDGAYQRRYERWLVLGLPVAFVPMQILQLLGSARMFSNQFGWFALDAASPIHVRGLDPVGAAAGAVIDASLLAVVPALVVLVLRYRRFGDERRRQIKWPLFSIAIAALSTVVLAVGPGPPTIPFWVAAVQYVGTQALLPAGLALGIVMYRGLEIEDVIRRSVVYGVLWALIAATYVVLATVFGIAVGQRVPLTLAVVLTIIATLVFQPARRSLEALADRIVFGPRLSGYELINRLGGRLQSTVAAEDVAGSVVSAVQAGLGAGWVRVLVREPATTVLASAGKVPTEARVALAVPLLHDGVEIGVIECGPKLEGRYDNADRQLLETFGRQASLAIRNSQLSNELSRRLVELAASRARLVQAEEAGRRRLERDLHDGVQQELVGVLARLGLARHQLLRGPELAESTLREAQLDVQGALETVQELARGIHPAILTDRGLVAAVEEKATRMTVPVQVHADGIQGRRFPLELEGAAYFLVSEGLANVLKHSSARRAQVRFRREPRQLVIEVEDDGKGFDLGSVQPSGLRGLDDRIEALGGRIELESHPGQGTLLRARLPLDEPADG